MDKGVRIIALKPSRVGEASRLLIRIIKDARHHYTKKETRDELRRAAELGSYYRKKVTFLRVAEADGRLVGIALCYLPPKLAVPICWITWVGVERSFRRRGIGSMLLRSLETGSRGRWRMIQCNVRRSNTCSNKMFAKAGYARIKSLRRKIRKRHAYRWEKVLHPGPGPKK